MTSSRKKSKVVSVVYTQDPKVLEIIVNDKPIEYYSKRALDYVILDTIIDNLKKGYYKLTVKGGGLGSLKEVVAKALYEHLDERKKEEIKLKYIAVTKTDIRNVQPKKAGGKKARARFQKSYR